MAKRISNIEELKKDYLAGNSLTKLQDKYGFERHALARALKASGITIVQNNQKHDYNSELFNEIRSEASAYWLGFLYADGSLDLKKPQVELSLKSTDIAHMVKLRDLVCTTLPIAYKEIKTKGKAYQAVRISLSNQCIYSQLIALGCPPRKSLTLSFPTKEQVPHNLHNHFIRGYFDGDGSVGVYTYNDKEPQIRCSFEGTEAMLRGIQAVFCDNISNYTAVGVSQRAKQKSCVLQKGGNASVEGLYDYMYKDATVFLERKKDIFDGFYKKQFAAQ